MEAMRQPAQTLKTLNGGDLVTVLLSDLATADDEGRECAALALGLLGDLRALDPLALALKDSDGCGGRDRGAWPARRREVRGAVFDFLDRLGDRRAIAVLELFIDDKANERLRMQVGQALRRLRESE